MNRLKQCRAAAGTSSLRTAFDATLSPTTRGGSISSLCAKTNNCIASTASLVACTVEQGLPRLILGRAGAHSGHDHQRDLSRRASTGYVAVPVVVATATIAGFREGRAHARHPPTRLLQGRRARPCSPTASPPYVVPKCKVKEEYTTPTPRHDHGGITIRDETCDVGVNNSTVDMLNRRTTAGSRFRQARMANRW
jgi:hypothetical protein